MVTDSDLDIVIDSSGCYKRSHRLNGLNKRHFFFTVLEAKNSEMKVLAYSVTSESPLPGLQTAIYLLCPRKAERHKGLSGVSSYKGTTPIMRTPLMTSSNPSYLPRAPSPNTITLRVRASTHDI